LHVLAHPSGSPTPVEMILAVDKFSETFHKIEKIS
jgi:hypothetical protein